MFGSHGKLKGEAGLVVRDSLRAARHAFAVSRQFAANVDPIRLERFSLLKNADRLADRAVVTASRLAQTALDMIESRRPLRLPASPTPFIAEEISADLSIAFTHACYEALRRALAEIGSPDALVMETRIEGAFGAAREEAIERDGDAAAFAAALAWSLLQRKAIMHLARFGATSATTPVGADGAALRACFALGLAIAAAHAQRTEEDEADSILHAACEMTLALDDELATVTSQGDLERLIRSYAPHV